MTRLLTIFVYDCLNCGSFDVLDSRGGRLSCTCGEDSEIVVTGGKFDRVPIEDLIYGGPDDA